MAMLRLDTLVSPYRYSVPSSQGYTHEGALYGQLHRRASGSDGLTSVSEPTACAVPLTDRVAPAPLDGSQVIKQIQKWGCHFDGHDPFAFIERLEEIWTGHRYPEVSMLLGLPELLRGDALLWYRNNRHTWRNWKDFDSTFRT